IAEPKLFETYNVLFMHGGIMKQHLKETKRCIEEGRRVLERNTKTPRPLKKSRERQEGSNTIEMC
ncbi:hypothetical protein, partial [Helicobacter suis]